MYHMDVPKTRQYDTGKVEVIARSSVGEAVAETELKVIPRQDDYRGVLKNSPRRKWFGKQNDIYEYLLHFTKILYTMHILPQHKLQTDKKNFNFKHIYRSWQQDFTLQLLSEFG